MLVINGEILSVQVGTLNTNLRTYYLYAKRTVREWLSYPLEHVSKSAIFIDEFVLITDHVTSGYKS